tara:strand:+ start:7439 stop:7696 length:258 start_codon:yes stop_codon:yes gene_type:complete
LKNKQKNIDQYIFQSLYGVIPKDVWIHFCTLKENPLDNLPSEERRRLKRKFRKLKRKSYVNKYDSFKEMWWKINLFLSKNTQYLE